MNDPSDHDGVAARPMDKRSVTIAGHRTSIALEPEFWAGLQEIAAERGLSMPRVVVEIDRARGSGNLASAIRLAVLQHYRRRALANSNPDPTAATETRA